MVSEQIKQKSAALEPRIPAIGRWNKKSAGDACQISCAAHDSYILETLRKLGIAVEGATAEYQARVRIRQCCNLCMDVRQHLNGICAPRQADMPLELNPRSRECSTARSAQVDHASHAGEVPEKPSECRYRAIPTAPTR